MKKYASDLLFRLDCDGFLSNFTAGALRVVERVTGKRFVEEDVTRFDFCDALELTREEKRRVMGAITIARGFAVNLPVYPGAINGVRRLRELGRVTIVTSPWPHSPSWREEREEWLRRHFGIPVEDVKHDSDKAGYDGDVFVDDVASHVAAWLAKRPDKLGVFWRTKHNTSEAVPVGAHSIGHWQRLIELIEDRAGVCKACEAGLPIAHFKQLGRDMHVGSGMSAVSCKRLEAARG